jgi:excisionase family DNA binding protein
MSEKLAFSIVDAAEKIGVSRSKLYQKIAEGAVRVVKIDGRRLVTMRELQRYTRRLEAEAGIVETGVRLGRSH